jgi:SAM-dependent methyltransferase
MSDLNRGAHWENVYRTKGEREVSWFQETPEVSLALIAAAGAAHDSAIIDIGGGASRLVDALLDAGYTDVTVLDVSDAALVAAKARLGGAAARATWIVSDVTAWKPPRRYDLWHDRAAYVACLTQALRPGGHAIIATFAPDGPQRCSGLPVVRYDGASLGQTLGSSFTLVEARRHDHPTPMGSTQRFQFSLFRRAP